MDRIFARKTSTVTLKPVKAIRFSDRTCKRYLSEIRFCDCNDAPYNTPVQTNGADAFKLALYLISRALEGVDARIVNTLHDEIIVEARDGIEDQVLTIVKESMEEALDLIIPEVPFAAEIRVAESWG
jgi:DNA polymerase I-like protein with 3'-5' exonuclease and polymerase domains